MTAGGRRGDVFTYVIEGVPHTRTGSAPVGSRVLGTIVSAVLLLGVGPGPVSAQHILAGVTPRPCGLDYRSLGVHYRAPVSGCEIDISIADPDLRFGAAMTDTDPNGGHFDYERNEFRRRAPKRVSDPNEIARILTEAYGRRSLLSKSATTVAKIAGEAESRSDRALGGMNAAADRLVRSAREIFRNDKLPKLKLRSKISTRYLGVGVSAAW